jgi:hypothetical protein
MKERLERTLIHIARRYAPPLVPIGWAQPGDYPRALSELAGALARYNVLVLLGDVPVPYTGDASVHIKLWADTYERLYLVLAQKLFPSYVNCTIYYADDNWPPIILLHGAATPLIVAMAGYIAPYIAARQSAVSVSDIELRGLMDLVLEELEASDLPRDEYQRLRNQAVEHIKDLLAVQVRQMPLTPAARPVFGMTSPPEAPSATTPARMTQMQPPATLPEENVAPKSDTGQHPSVPVFFERKPNGVKPLPPIPDLPDSDGD